ncbi:hypothetical protein ASG84_18260 [Rhodococcus sp. Leaf278]|uniref:ANTAR domain-containing protein n=1 Tax=Rhodococcus sp. Leaf278 TaxID=1736319 RepID=UPI00070ED224|nr:ANTAR domain-containing protein [Rhodococcus sp. Leaf278]KQU56969.1 hypothetical protein ASG84_18260 [Rhodococcus sp. Leaf278]
MAGRSGTDPIAPGEVTAVLLVGLCHRLVAVLPTVAAANAVLVDASGTTRAVAGSSAATKACLSLPMNAGPWRGSVSVHSTNGIGFSNEDEGLIRTLTAAVQDVVRMHRDAAYFETELDGLRTAMATRASIEQAKGIVMAIRGVGPEAAFEMLSAQSQMDNNKLVAVAQEIVASVHPRDGRQQQHR